MVEGPRRAWGLSLRRLGRTGFDLLIQPPASFAHSLTPTPLRSNLQPGRSFRRKRGVTINVVEQVVQLINLLAFVVTNSFVVHYECQVLSAKVAWSGFVQ